MSLVTEVSQEEGTMNQSSIHSVENTNEDWALSTTQIAAVSETLIAAQLMLISKGRFSTFVPQADDDGIDLIVLDKPSRQTIPIQIKAALVSDDKPRATVQFDTRVKTFRKHEETFILCVAIDERTADIRRLWLIPTTELEAVSNATTRKLAIAPSTKADSKDRYTPYRYDSIKDIAEKLAEVLDRDPS